MELPVAWQLLTVVLAVIFGFVVHRASICNVKAVEELLTTRSAYMFSSFGKAVLWVILTTLIMLFITPTNTGPDSGTAFSIYSIAGGFVCGLGMGLCPAPLYANTSYIG